MDVKIYNGTPHSINIVEGATFSPAIRKYVGGNVVRSIPSNGMLNADIDTVKLPSIGGIPRFGKAIRGADPLPEGYDVYIVSSLYATALQREGRDMSKVYIVSDPVYTEDGNSFVGCRGICYAY